MWIETFVIVTDFVVLPVTPFVGVWIETMLPMKGTWYLPVTPFVGVWIETDYFRNFAA